MSSLEHRFFADNRQCGKVVIQQSPEFNRGAVIDSFQIDMGSAFALGNAASLGYS
jgi:hypothetical protein